MHLLNGRYLLFCTSLNHKPRLSVCVLTVAMVTPKDFLPQCHCGVVSDRKSGLFSVFMQTPRSDDALSSCPKVRKVQNHKTTVPFTHTAFKNSLIHLFTSKTFHKYSYVLRKILIVQFGPEFSHTLNTNDRLKEENDLKLFELSEFVVI